MSPKRKLILLITPSWVSVLIGLVLTIVMVVTSSILFAEHSGRFGTFNLSQYVSTTGITSLGTLIKTFFSSLRFNSILTILFWVIIGFITYNIVYLFKGSVDESVTFFQRFHYVHAHPASIRRQLALRITLLFIALLFWIVFALLFSWEILPMIIGLINHSIGEGGSPAFVVLGFVIALLTTHVATILMRFTLLKVRVSGSGDIE
jgi:hypothetical protein